MNGNPAWILIFIGAAILLVGLIWVFAPGIPLGRLPGDIRIERGNTRIYIPLVTCLLLSILLSAIVWIANWWKQ